MGLISRKQILQFHDQGFFVTKPMFTPAQCKELSAEFDRLHKQLIRDAKKSGDPGAVEIAKNRPFIGQVHTRSPAAARWVKAPIYVEACRIFLGPSADLYYNQAVLKPAKTGMSFGWHQDNGYRLTIPLEYITCWTAVSKTTVANGCIWVIPESHKWGLIPHRRDQVLRETIAVFDDESKAIPVEMEPGQIAVFNSLLLHRSGANTTGRVRRGFVPQYHMPGVLGADTKTPWGDQWPVLRDGKAVKGPYKKP